MEQKYFNFSDIVKNLYDDYENCDFTIKDVNRYRLEFLNCLAQTAECPKYGFDNTSVLFSSALLILDSIERDIERKGEPCEKQRLCE